MFWGLLGHSVSGISHVWHQRATGLQKGQENSRIEIDEKAVACSTQLLSLPKIMSSNSESLAFPFPALHLMAS